MPTLASRYAGYAVNESIKDVPTCALYFNTQGVRQDYILSAVDIQTILADTTKFLKKYYPELVPKSATTDVAESPKENVL